MNLEKKIFRRDNGGDEIVEVFAVIPTSELRQLRVCVCVLGLGVSNERRRILIMLRWRSRFR